MPARSQSRPLWNYSAKGYGTTHRPQSQDAIDALLDYLAVHYQSRTDDDGHVYWTAERKAKGWIVPIAAGFHGVSALGQAEHQRDLDTPHRFAESLVTLGEFVMPHRQNVWTNCFGAAATTPTTDCI